MTVARVHEARARVVDQTEKDGAAFTHIHPKDVGGAILSLDHLNPKERCALDHGCAEGG
jgi:hypothetical protein